MEVFGDGGYFVTMLDGEKKVHRPERLKGYNYTAPGYYFVTFNTKLRGEDILCTLELQSGVEHHVGPDPQVRPFLGSLALPKDGAGPSQLSVAVAPAQTTTKSRSELKFFLPTFSF